MKNWMTLPHEKLIAYQAARQLLSLVREAHISNPRIREQALNAASSACLNIAEATGRSGSADQKRVHAIERGEVCEAAAALDIAAVAGGCAADTAVAAPKRKRKPKTKTSNENRSRSRSHLSFSFSWSARRAAK
jgi:four helix bundle protein